MREVPAAAASLVLRHVLTCQCKSVPVPDAAGDDAKLIDARCISAYAVPEEESNG